MERRRAGEERPAATHHDRAEVEAPVWLASHGLERRVDEASFEDVYAGDMGDGRAASKELIEVFASPKNIRVFSL